LVEWAAIPKAVTHKNRLIIAKKGVLPARREKKKGRKQKEQKEQKEQGQKHDRGSALTPNPSIHSAGRARAERAELVAAIPSQEREGAGEAVLLGINTVRAISAVAVLTIAFMLGRWSR
jgi:hypothetical protein